MKSCLSVDYLDLEVNLNISGFRGIPQESGEILRFFNYPISVNAIGVERKFDRHSGILAGNDFSE